MKLIDKTIFIDATPESVYRLLTEAESLMLWIAPSARSDPRSGGQLTWTHQSGDSVVGQFIELVPGQRVVFSFGWDRPDVEVPEGSTVVEIDLKPQRGGTLLRLVHRGLDGPMADAHDGGWTNYLSRLAALAEGGDPGPDPLVDQRVPAARDLHTLSAD
jgi:uncharacterized protein YndB with AHSA1/START domain